MLRRKALPRQPALVERSPLRRADPRTKLLLCLCASLAVMLPLERLAAFMALYALLLAWARLIPQAARQVWRIRWLLVGLFVIDWLVVGLDLAAIVTLRLLLLSGVMALFVGTTTPDELRLALERLRVPYHYAFSLSLAFQSIGLLEEEWHAIREAQQARGAWSPGRVRWREVPGWVRDLVALTVPAVVLAAKRAWGMTEAACARGLDAPHRRPYRRLTLGRLDWALLALVACVGIAFALWQWVCRSGVASPL